MCFSPQADFTAGAVIAGVGVATLRRVRVRRELIVGALPLLFGIHQLVEGFVWLGLRGEVSSGLGDTAKQVYIGARKRRVAMTAGGLMAGAEGLAAPQLADCRAHESAYRKRAIPMQPPPASAS
jgi:hypothetical protein